MHINKYIKLSAATFCELLAVRWGDLIFEVPAVIFGEPFTVGRGTLIWELEKK